MVEVGKVTTIIDGDISQLNTALSQARSKATSEVAGIEKSIKGQLGSGITGAFSGGSWTTAGKNIGETFISGITSSFGPLGTALGEVATTLGPTGIVATAAVAGAAVIAKAASDAAMAWEAGMSGISKTTGIAKGTEEFSALNEQLKDLYATMPTTMDEIQSVAKSAGSLGIEKDAIAGYTEVALQMGSAFDIPAEEAAVAVGKVQSQLKKLPEGADDSAEFARKFGSAVDYAGNSMNATEAEVLDFSTRTAGALSLLGGSAYEIAGWGGATASVFSSSQLAAGSFNAALTQLTGTTKGSLDAQAKAAELLGVTQEEFLKMMSTDPSETVLKLGNALEELDPAEATKAAGILGGGYGDDFFKKMIGHTDEWRGKIEEVVEAGEKGESIGTSFAAGAENAKSGLQELKNTVSTMLIDIGGPINDVVNAIAGNLAGGLNKVREIGENLWGPLTTILSPATTGLSMTYDLLSKIAGIQLDGLVKASELINSAWQLGSKYAGAIRDELVELVGKSETFQTVAGYVDNLKDSFQGVYDKVKEVFDKIADGLANAIPTAISGTGDALGTLAEKAGLGGVADAAGGLFSFFGDVNARVWGEEAGDQMADGIKGSELPNAPGEALSNDDALKGAEKAADSFSERYTARVKSGVSKELAGVMEGFGVSDTRALEIINAQTSSSDGYKGLFGRGSGSRIVHEQSVEFRINYHSTKHGTEVSLLVDGQKMASGKGYSSQEEAIADLFKQADFELSEETSLLLQDRGGEAAKIRMSQDVELSTEARLKELSSLDLETMRTNIAEIESEIAGLASGLDGIDKAFEEISIEPINLTVALQTEQARNDWDTLVRDIEGLTVRIPVELNVQVNADDIRALVADEIRAALA